MKNNSIISSVLFWLSVLLIYFTQAGIVSNRDIVRLIVIAAIIASSVSVWYGFKSSRERRSVFIAIGIILDFFLIAFSFLVLATTYMRIGDV